MKELASKLINHIYMIYERLRKFLFDWQMDRFLRSVGVDCYSTFRIPVTTKIYAVSKLVIGQGLTAGDNCVIDANDSFGIYIGDNLLIAPDVFIGAGNRDYSYFDIVRAELERIALDFAWYVIRGICCAEIRN